MTALPKRLARFGLTIHRQKTALIAFSQPSLRQEGAKGKGTFEFLGFPHSWAQSRRGYWVIKRRTAKKRVRRTRQALWQWCCSNRHLKVMEQDRVLCQKLRGHYQYYGIRGNYRLRQEVFQQAARAWRHWLSRRRQKGTLTGDKIERWRARFPFPAPRILHNI